MKFFKYNRKDKSFYYSKESSAVKAITEEILREIIYLFEKYGQSLPEETKDFIKESIKTKTPFSLEVVPELIELDAEKSSDKYSITLYEKGYIKSDLTLSTEYLLD